MTKDENSWREVTTEIFKFEEPGQEITGIFVSKRTCESLNNNDNFIYGIEVAPGNITFFFGTQFLNERLATIPIGSRVRVVYDHNLTSIKKGYSPMKFFRVFVKD